MPSTDRRNLRKIVEATGSWIHYERLCRRHELFSESYLAYPVGQVLQARYGTQLRTEFAHPELMPAAGVPGDKPRVDYIVVDAKETPLLAVEAKWLSSARDLVVQTVRDLVRLELLANAYGAECLFLLAGTRRQLRSFTSSAHFRGHPDHPNSRTLLPDGDVQVAGSLWLDTAAVYRQELFRKALRRFAGRQIARAIVLHRVGPFPREGRLDDYMAIGWRVSARVSGTFDPGVKYGEPNQGTPDA